MVSIYNEYLIPFSNYPVYNNVSERIIIPGLVEAEDYAYQEGLSTEVTSDINGGLNIGYTDSGDFADYLVLVTESGDYDINFRAASENQSGSILLQLIDGAEVQNLTQISLPTTGGWQTWETVSASTTLNEGSYKLRMKVIQPGFNLNWIEFDYTGNSMALNDNFITDFRLYPNPANDLINLDTQLDNFKVEIFDLLVKKLFESYNLKIIDITNYDKGTYLLKVSSGYKSNSKLFIKK